MVNTLEAVWAKGHLATRSRTKLSGSKMLSTGPERSEFMWMDVHASHCCIIRAVSNLDPMELPCGDFDFLEEKQHLNRDINKIKEVHQIDLPARLINNMIIGHVP